jgi:hypothetical protein
MKRLVLVAGGHAHVEVLRELEGFDVRTQLASSSASKIPPAPPKIPPAPL